MSWIEKIQQDMVITTGDGTEHRPLYINASRQREYNVSEFEFVDVSGTYVPRKRPKGVRYFLELFFQGDDHLDAAERLEQSTNENTQPWQLSHPLYGNISVQPTSLTFDNSDLNISKVSAAVIESITPDQATTLRQDPANKIAADAAQIFNELPVELAVTTPVIAVATRQNLVNELEQSYRNVAQWVTNAADANNYLNELNASTAILNKAGSSTVDIARGLQRFTALPYAFSDNIENRLRIFKTQFDIIAQSARNLFKRNSKKLAEYRLSHILTAAVLATVTDSDYDNADRVEQVLDGILDMQNRYITVMDDMSTGENTAPDSYEPDYDSVSRISFLVSYVNDMLLEIVQRAKVKRVYVLPKDMVLFDIVYRLYGYDEKDENLEKLMSDNNICFNELYLLPKGRQIIYYK